MADKYSSSMTLMVVLLMTLGIGISCAVEYGAYGAPLPPQKFSDDYYKVYGGPDITASLERSSIYQGDKTSLFLTLTNRGRITSFEVNEEPAANKREEILAASRELELEKQRITAQDVSVRLAATNESAIDIRRSVAYIGNIREGQTSSSIEFPVEIYENTPRGAYSLYAIINYTYQRDVAVEGDEDRPEDPDIYYWYENRSQKVPLSLNVIRESGVDFMVVDVSPEHFQVGSKDNIVRIIIENTGDESAQDLVARLRPESGVYVSVDESPIPSLDPGDRAELIYKIDISEDAISTKRYRLTLTFEFSDAYRDRIEDDAQAYITLDKADFLPLPLAAMALAVLAILVFLIIRKKVGRR